MTVPDQARREVQGLVDRFARNLDVYTRPEYKETQVRVEFIDPFFEALGWDVRNVKGYAEQYKDVIHE
ncbi:MAG TPA: type IV restriction endonuclease, partial [Chloroflexi bacterium]|nr:type IV restriction endonuclease [Chloroflexota bacterium]